MIGIFIFFVLMYFLFAAGIKVYRKNKMEEIEIAFIKAALHYHDLKYQMLQMLEIIYEKASETDPEYLKDYERIKETLDKKFHQTCDEFIADLQKTLGYNTSYKNWDELITQATFIFTLANKKNNGSGKGN